MTQTEENNSEKVSTKNESTHGKFYLSCHTQGTSSHKYFLLTNLSLEKEKDTDHSSFHPTLQAEIRGTGAVRILTFCWLLTEVPGCLSYSSPGWAVSSHWMSHCGHQLEGQKNFPFTLRGALAGLIIKLTQGRVTRENQNYVWRRAP